MYDLYSEDDKELELKENIDDGIDFNLDENKPSSNRRRKNGR